MFSPPIHSFYSLDSCTNKCATCDSVGVCVLSVCVGAHVHVLTCLF